MNDKTIRELAAEFNISKEAIYKKINYSMKFELEDYVIKHNKKTYIRPKGQSIILQSLKKETQDAVTQVKELDNHKDNKSSDTKQRLNNRHEDELLEVLKNQIEILNEQINNHIKEKQELLDLNKTLVNTLSFSTKIEISKLIEGKYGYVEPVKETFFKKLFNWFA